MAVTTRVSHALKVLLQDKIEAGLLSVVSGGSAHDRNYTVYVVANLEKPKCLISVNVVPMVPGGDEDYREDFGVNVAYDRHVQGLKQFVETKLDKELAKIFDEVDVHIIDQDAGSLNDKTIINRIVKQNHIESRKVDLNAIF